MQSEKVDLDALYNEGADLANSILEQEPSIAAVAIAIGLLIADASRQITENVCCEAAADADSKLFTDLMSAAGNARTEFYQELVGVCHV